MDSPPAAASDPTAAAAPSGAPPLAQLSPRAPLHTVDADGPLGSASAFLSALSTQPLATVWLVFRRYGWYILGAAIVAYMVYIRIRPWLEQVHARMTALPEVNADEDKVILARARQQLELELKAREAKEKREAERRAAVLEGDQPQSKLRRRPENDPKAPRPQLSPAAWGLDGESGSGSGGAHRFGRNRRNRGGGCCG